MAVPVHSSYQQQQQQQEHPQQQNSTSPHQAKSGSPLFTFPHPPRPSNSVVIPSTPTSITKADNRNRSKWARRSFSESSTILQLKPFVSSSLSTSSSSYSPHSKQPRAQQPHKHSIQKLAPPKNTNALSLSSPLHTRNSTSDSIKRRRATSTASSGSTPRLFFSSSVSQLSSSPPSFNPSTSTGPTAADTQSTSFPLDRRQRLAPHLQHFSDTGVSRKRLERLRWLDPRYYTQGGPLADMDTLSRDGTSLSSPSGGEWELVENGPRKSIDQLWDEVYDYRRKLQQEQLALAQSLPVHASGAMSFLNMVAAGSNHQDHPSAHLSPDDGYFGDDSFRPAFRNRANSSSSVTGRRPFQRSAPRRRNTLNGGPASVSHSYAPSSSLSSSNAFSRHRYNSWSEYDDVHHQGHHHHSSSSSSSSSRGDFYDLPVVEECRDDEIEDEEEDMNDDEYTEQEYNGHAHSHVALALDDEMDVEHALNSSGPSGSAMAGLLLDDTMVSLEDYYSSLATSLTSLTSQSEGQQQLQQQQPSADPRSRSSSIFSSKDASAFPLKKRGGAGPGSALASHAHSPSSVPPPPSLALKIQPTSPRTLPFVPNLPVLSLPSSSQSPLSPCTMSPSPTTSSTTPPLASSSASSEYAFYAALSSSLSSLACTCGGPFGNTPTLTTSPFFSLPPTPTSPSYLAHHSNGPDHEPSCPLHWQQTARLDPTNVFANKNRARVEPGAAMGLLRSYLVQSGTSDRKHTRGTGGLKAATYGYHKQQQHQPVKSKRLSLPFF